jgi:hypothetical protein
MCHLQRRAAGRDVLHTHFLDPVDHALVTRFQHGKLDPVEEEAAALLDPSKINIHPPPSLRHLGANAALCARDSDEVVDLGVLRVAERARSVGPPRGKPPTLCQQAPRPSRHHANEALGDVVRPRAVGRPPRKTICLKLQRPGAQDVVRAEELPAHVVAESANGAHGVDLVVGDSRQEVADAVPTSRSRPNFSSQTKRPMSVPVIQ